MNTAIEIKAFADIPRVDLENAIENAFQEFHSVVARFTRFSESSELGLLNKSNGKFIEVAADLFSLVEFGYKLGIQTDGLFDITIIDILEAYGYDKDYNFSKLDDPYLKDRIQKLVKDRPSFREIEFDKEALKIKLAINQRIDMGGYAKGYATRLAKDRLIKMNIDDFLINAGGDIYAYGSDKGNLGWKISILDPQKSIQAGDFASLKEIILKDEALACSGPWARKIKFFHHLINPRTGKPAGESNSVIWAIDKDPMLADAMATIEYLKSTTV